MGKSAKINRYEPTDTSWDIKFLECTELFRTVGWFNFFKRIDGFNPKVSHLFSQNFINETVTFSTLRFELTECLIVEAICVPTDGEAWFKKILSVSILTISCYQGMKLYIGAKEFH